MSSVDEAPVEEAVAADPRRVALLEALGDLAVDSVVTADEITVRVANERWRDAVAVCRDRLGMDYFGFLGGMDWLDNPALSGEKVWGALPEEEGDAEDAADTEDAAPAAGIQTGVAGGQSRFQVICRLYSTTKKIGITLKADLDEAAPSIASIADIYRGADWHEREAWEMYGFDFPGHPGLRHIYLPGGFEGHPLRKDFPLLAREVKPWPGLVDVEPLPGGGDEEAEAE